MRSLVLGFALLLGLAGQQWASAAEPASASASSPAVLTRLAATGQFNGLFAKLRLNPLVKAQAKECADEGESCSSSEECCFGLRCTGTPQQSTCAEED